MMFKPTAAVIIGVIVIAALIGGGIFFWLQAKSARGLNIELVMPDEVLTGVPFELRAKAANSSSSVLKDARLSLTLPEGIVFLGQSAQKTVEYRDLGNLEAGSLVQESFKLLVTSGKNSIKKLSASVVYLPEKLGARFEKEASQNIAVGISGLQLDVVTPAKVFGGEDFETLITYKNIAPEDFRDLQLIIEYPPTFTFLKSDLPPDVEKREWHLGDLRTGSEGKLKITGNLIGPDDAFFDFRVFIKAKFLGEFYLINSRTATISLSPSPLSLAINLNEDPDFIARPGDVLNYIFNYTNRTDIALHNVVIRAKLVGAMFDFSKLVTNGAFRATDQTIIWNASADPGLLLVPSGGSGSVTLNLRVRSDYPIRRLGDKNFILKVSSEIESPTVPYFVAATKTLGLAKLETKVGGFVDIDTTVFFRDADSGILNQGSFPPRASQPTNYTVHWRIKNYGTDVSNVEVRAFLGPNVRMTGAVKSNFGAAPIYNESAQEVLWQIPRIAATRGVIDQPPEAIFQIEATPSQAGNYWPLIGITTLKAIDDFTGLEITDADEPVSTRLPDDLTVGSQQGIVLQ